MTRDITGQKFNRLVALSSVGQDRHGKYIWEFLCDCGNHVQVRRSDVTTGKTQSCGCLNSEEARRRVLTHGMKGTRIYGVWLGMKARCTFPSVSSYPNYGGRGIEVCQEWRDSFEDFYFYVAQLPHFGKEGYTLDRIDNGGDYIPGNVRWATKLEQGNNKRNNQMIESGGKEQCAAAWAKELGISAVTLRWRIRKGWDVESALGLCKEG